MKSKEYVSPSWNDIYEMCLDLSDKIRRSGFKPEVIVGIARGGWIPARILSDLLGNPYTANIKIEFYVSIKETSETPVITQPLSTSVDRKRTLVVDDVADTGKSLRIARLHVLKQGAREVKTSTLYYKPWSVIKPDYYVEETSAWIIFPWEVKETIVKLAEKMMMEGMEIKEIKETLYLMGVNKKLVNRFIRELKS